MMASPLRVHIIDDDIDDVYLIRKILEDKSVDAAFDVSSSTRMSEGIKALKETPAHVVLLDLSLPDAAGFEGLLEIQKQIPSSNIIILTGLKDQDWALSALKQGASDYLMKDELNPMLLSRTILYSHERQKLEEQLRQSRKIEAIGQLAGGIAHDFNNQLGILRLLLDQFEDHAQGKPELSKLSNDMTLIVEKCAQMTRQILGFCRKQALFPVQINVNHFVSQIAPFADRLLGSDIQLKLQLDPTAGSINVDPNQLEQVIWNLILNARDSLKTKRIITLRTGHINATEVVGSIEKIETNAPLTFIEIADTGHGISAEVLEKIFDPFFTTKPQGEGTGLGLSTALGFIRQSGGYMAVDSRPQEGSRFQILMPTVSGSAAAQLPAEEDKAKSLDRFSVLVCDDEPLLRELISSSFEEKGLRVFQAKDGQEGLEIFQKHSSEIKLIITDLTMPKLSGSELILKALDINPQLKSVVMTGFSKPNFNSTLAQDSVTVISKPFSMTELVRLAIDSLND